MLIEREKRSLAESARSSSLSPGADGSLQKVLLLSGGVTMFQLCVHACVCVCEVGLKSRCSQKCSGCWQGFRQAVKCKLACNTSSWECRGCLAIRHSPRVSHKRILFSERMSSAFCTGSFKLNVGKRRVLSKHNSLASLKAGARLSCRPCSLLFIGGLFASPLHTPGK